MTRINHKHRRGLSSVVGAVFMVLIMIGALNVVLLTVRQQDSVTQAVVDRSNSNLNRLNEQISISDIRVTDDNRLNMTITNNGGTAAQIASIYLTNETASPKSQNRYDIDDVVLDGRESESDVGIDLPFHIDSDARYTVKVVTLAGNTAVASISPLSSTPLEMAMYLIPPTITSGQNVTVLFAVNNNNTESTLAATVSPTITADLSCSPFPSATCDITEKVSANTDVLIPAGSTYLFKWTYEVKGPVGTTITFNASLVNAHEGNFVIETGRIQAVSSAQIAETFLFARLIQQPEILPLFPNPSGTPATSSAYTIWGGAVANPTEQAMKIRKLVITVFSPRGQSQDQIIPSGSACSGGNAPVVIKPSTGTWSCPATNTLVWTTSSPLSIPAHSAQEFLVGVHKGSLPNGGGDVQSYLINFNVFTDYGQFTKSGYDGAIRQNTGPNANVYLSSTTESTSTSNMMSFVSVSQGNTIKVNATIADLDSSTATKIDAGTKLVIDVPKDFSNVVVTSSSGFDSCAPQVFSDGSSQISCALSADLTGASGVDAKTIQFTMDAPTVDHTKLYVLYVLADGTADGGAFVIGPVAETVVQVLE